MRCALLPLVAQAAPPAAAWQPLHDLLSSWQFTDDFAVSVGVADGAKRTELFVHEQGKMTMTTKVGTASTSKWPMAMALAGAVDDGSIPSLDTPVHTIVPWWTSDPSDLRSKITMRHLLSFTSGFGGGAPGDEIGAMRNPEFLGASKVTPACMNNASFPDYDECAKVVYQVVGGPGGVNITGTPGTVYSYNSYHLQLAGAVVQRATGLTMQQVLKKYLTDAYDMVDTSCEGPNPQLAICLTTTGRDYANFLSGVLGYSPLSKAIVDESEKDSTPFLAKWYTLYGDYGFGHFLSCFDSVNGFTKDCKNAQIHADPGAYGFYPMIDRKNQYYLEVVAYEHTAKTYPRSGIPEYLAQLVKPIVDDIMAGKDVSDSSQHSTPAHQRMSLVDVNYIADCYLHPLHCLGAPKPAAEPVLV
mmetsp:Transcript_12419/g.27463  ORF Transcript_12419/g.27463 Transcript_12419/m.27463 type:complete len:414 (-) Transcript_12419:131-1372(-)